MKILFLENRYKTRLYELVAEHLLKNEHEIHFLVQNHDFKPSKRFVNHLIKYPNSSYKKTKDPYHIDKVIESDRQINHFQANDNSYFYYYDEKIYKSLKDIKPDIVFGESTAFHELITIENCKKLDIPYLNPCTCRYPTGRFSFYKYETLVPFKGSNKELEDGEALKIINQIVEKTAKPDYMKIKPKSKKEILIDNLKKLTGYVKGERYNTPHPLVKLSLEKKKNKRIEIWDFLSEEILSKSKEIKILYPLQMQPEANIDVWGRKFRNQTELIETIVSNLPEDCVLYVKPNPKSNYELNNQLLNFVEKSDQVRSLSHSAKMEDIIHEVDLVITVTGTIAIECILSNKPVISLVKNLNNDSSNCYHVQDLEKDLIKFIDILKKKDWDVINQKEKINFINQINRTSYKGIISDPFTNINCIADNNIQELTLAFNDVILEYEN
mgnify:CR=1 FL=1